MSTSTLRRCAVAVVLSVAACAVPSRASAQATGAIAGLVTDPSGGALPGVSIEVASRDTGTVRTAVTGADGFFTVPLVNPGVYRVTASLSGFRTTARDTVTVVVNETVRADLSMPLAGITETLVIAAESPLVETTNATLGVVIDAARHADSRRRRAAGRPRRSGRQRHARRIRECHRRLQRQRPAQPVEQLPARRRVEQRLVQHRLRAAAAARRHPGVQDPHPLVRRGVRA
jgi:Carboxypeptidase regulatory-like domain